jgi:hypothetical protein
MKRFLIFCVGLFVATVPLLQAQGESPQGVSPDEARFRALEDRIRALEGEIVALRAAQPSGAAPSPAVQEPVQVPSAPLPIYGGAAALSKALNPDIGVIGNFIGGSGRNIINPSPALTLSESEFSFQAIVDPYARADFFLAVGEEGAAVEEGYITFQALPGGLSLKAGQMRSSFGKINPFHNHSLPWVDRPLLTYNLLGGELGEADAGIKDAGLSLSRILPAPPGLFLEGTAEVYAGNSGELFESSRRSDVSTLYRLRGYKDLSESTNLEVGGSYARGHNDLGSDFLTHVAGLDATLRWKPLRRAIYHSFVARTEFVWSRREDVQPLVVSSPWYDPCAFTLPSENGCQPTGPRTTLRANGFYASADYQLARRWFGGARFDWAERARDPFAHDSAQSVVLTFWPSEFSQIRGQLRRTQYAEGHTANEFLFQFQYTLGAHGAHPF